MTHATASFEAGLTHYLGRAARVPMLTQEEELTLAKKYRSEGDRSAADRLVTSHLRLVAKVAFGFRGYGLPIADLISEGSVGMIKAVEHFDPDRGVRLSAYARWWIRAQIQEYVLHSWSMVKMGTTVAQKKLFFNLMRLKAQLKEIDSGISPEAVRQIAVALDVPEADVVGMNARLSGIDSSLSASAPDDETSWQDRLADEKADQETEIGDRDEKRQHLRSVALALPQLPARAQEIIRARFLTDKPIPFAVLATRYAVTPQRIRQIESQAVAKLRALMKTPRAVEMPAAPQYAA